MKKSKKIKLIAILVSMNYINIGFCQDWHKKTEDERYRITLNDDYISLLNINHAEMISEVSLGIEWWTLMGEPIEIYEFKWLSSSMFRIDTAENVSQDIFRSQLGKYPDLLKRFDNLRPSSIEIEIRGGFRSWDEEFMDPIEKGEFEYSFWHPMYAKPVLSGYSGDFRFYYIIRNTKLIISKSGKVGKDIIPSSPSKWQNFLQYYNNSLLYDIIENGDNGVSELEEKEQKEQNKKLKKLFTRSKQVNIRINKLTKLEWPEYELKAIAELFNQYERGEKKPSPNEALGEMLKVVESTTPYTKNDFWGEAMQDVPLIPKKDENSGIWGYENELGEQVIPNLFNHAEPFENGWAIVSVNSKKGIVDKKGVFRIQPIYDEIVQVYNNVAIVGLNKSGGHIYSERNIPIKFGLINLNGEKITSIKFSSISKFENGFAKAEIFDRRETLSYSDCSDAFLDFFKSGNINLAGSWHKPSITVLEISHPPNMGNALYLTSSSETTAERKARKAEEARAKERERICITQKREDITSAKNEVLSKGGQVR